MNIEELVLERVLMQITTTSHSSIYLRDSRIHAREVSDVADRIAYTLTGWMLGNKFPDRSEFETVSYPDGAWQMLKEQYAPQWVLDRWPVRMKDVRYESARFTYHICPHFNQPFERDGGHVHFHFMKTPLMKTPPEPK